MKTKIKELFCLKRSIKFKVKYKYFIEFLLNKTFLNNTKNFFLIITGFKKTEVNLEIVETLYNKIDISNNETILKFCLNTLILTSSCLILHFHMII